MSIDEPEFDGERYVPSVGGNIRLAHVHRYLVAQQLVGGMRVLDLGCGEGYGSELLAHTANEVVGVDLDPGIIEYASGRYGTSSLTFLAGSATDVPLPDGSVDAVVCFEAIEHVDDQDGLLAEVRRVLRPEGFVVLSTPDKREYADLPGFANRFHVRELYADQFEELLDRHFRHHQLYGQRVEYGSVVAPFGRLATRFAAFRDMDDGHHAVDGLHRPLFFLAVASNAILPVLPAGLYSTEAPGLSPDDFKRMSDDLAGERQRLQELRMELERRQAIVEGDLAKLDQARRTRAISSPRRRALRVLARTLPSRPLTWIWPNPLFDADWYRANNPDVNAAGVNPQTHYRRHGAREGRNPSADFDTAYYLASNPDVATTRLSPLDHFVLFGAAEGRRPNSLS